MFNKEVAALLTDDHCFRQPGINQYGQLSNCNRILIFRVWFPTIPRKISAYLRTEFPSGANTRKIIGFYKILNIKDLCLKGVFLYCKKHHFGLRNGPFQGLKSTISHPKMGLIALRNGQYWKVKRTFPDYGMGYIKRL